MARTKNQASAGRAEAAQRSRTINGGEGSRFDTSEVGTAYGDEASSALNSDRERRVARRRLAVPQKVSEATTWEAGVHATAEEAGNEGNDDATRKQVNNGQASRVNDRTDRQDIGDETISGVGGTQEPNHGQKGDEDEIEPTREIADDEVGQAIGTEPADIDADAKEGTPSNEADERRGRAYSEAPSIKIPHKPTKGSGAAKILPRNPGTSEGGEGRQRGAAEPSARATGGGRGRNDKSGGHCDAGHHRHAEEVREGIRQEG